MLEENWKDLLGEAGYAFYAECAAVFSPADYPLALWALN
jgi:hypothetical protein